MFCLIVQNISLVNMILLRYDVVIIIFMTVVQMDLHICLLCSQGFGSPAASAAMQHFQRINHPMSVSCRVV